MTENKSMFDILSNMNPSLFESSNSVETEGESSESTLQESTLIHDEFIANEVAEKLIGADYDPACRYKLISSYDSTCVVKIDPRIAEDAEPVLDKEGRIIKGHLVEYPLTANDEVLSYSDMMSRIQGNVSNISSLTYRRSIYDIPKASNSWIYVVISIIVALTVLGLGIITYLSGLN